MENSQENEKILKLPVDIIDIFTDLATDDSLYNDLVFFGLDKPLIENVKKESVLNLLIEIEVDKKRASAKDILKAKLGLKDTEIAQIIKNLEDGLWEEFDEVYKEIEEEKSELIKTVRGTISVETSKSNEANHISHIDVLSEIENPTPSIRAPLTPQREATTESQATPNSLRPLSKDSSTRLSSPNPSLHSSPSIAPYVNPALHIASKLDQNLSNPSASVPKEMYVSKKPDPYHEPLDL